VVDGNRCSESVISPIHDKGGNPVAVGIIYRDVSMHRQTEETLAQQHSTLRMLIDNLPDNIFIKDLQHRFTVANLAVARLTGHASPDELMGKTDFDFFAPEMARRYQADEAAVLKTGTPMINREEPVTDTQGKTIGFSAPNCRSATSWGISPAWSESAITLPTLNKLKKTCACKAPRWLQAPTGLSLPIGTDVLSGATKRWPN